MKRTNIVLDEKMVNKIRKITGIKSIKGVVDYVLKEYLQREKQLEIIKLRGKVKWTGDLDEMRTV